MNTGGGNVTRGKVEVSRGVAVNAKEKKTIPTNDCGIISITWEPV